VAEQILAPKGPGFTFPLEKQILQRRFYPAYGRANPFSEGERFYSACGRANPEKFEFFQDLI
jgi:hypothetical protein